MHRVFAPFQFDDHRFHTFLGKRIEPAQELAKVGNFLLELITLLAHGSPRWFRREQTRSQSSMAAEIGAMMTLTVQLRPVPDIILISVAADLAMSATRSCEKQCPLAELSAPNPRVLCCPAAGLQLVS